METWQEIHKKKQNKRSRRRLLILLIIVLILGAAGGYAYQQYQAKLAAEAAEDPKLPGEGETAAYARVLSIYGNEMVLQWEETGEEEKLYIPVETPVTTQLNVETTFSRLAEQDRILIISKEGKIRRIFMVSEESEEKASEGAEKSAAGDGNSHGDSSGDGAPSADGDMSGGGPGMGGDSSSGEFQGPPSGGEGGPGMGFPGGLN